MNKKYSELAELFRSEKTDEEILDFLLNYHKNDIADMMAGMTEEERKRLYHLLGAQKVAEIFKYIEEPRKYIRELSVETTSNMRYQNSGWPFCSPLLYSGLSARSRRTFWQYFRCWPGSPVLPIQHAACEKLLARRFPASKHIL